MFVFINFKSKPGHQRKSNSNRFIPRTLQEDTSSKNIVWSPQKHCCTANGSCILYASTLQSQRSLWMCILFRWSSVYSIDRAQLQHNTNGFVLWQRIIPSTPPLPTYNPGRPLQGQLHLCGRVRFVSLVDCKIVDFKLFAKKWGKTVEVVVFQLVCTNPSCWWLRWYI